MGSPISGTMAEIFLQHIENKHIKQALDTKNIILYTRFVDDILIIYDSTRTTADDIHKYINNIHDSLQFSPTHENKVQINFLDLNITKKTNKLEKVIYRKPTTTDTTINYLSNHPIEHKLAAYRYHINRMLEPPLTKEERTHEWNIIQNMARNNNFPNRLITNLKQIEPNTKQQQPEKKENTNKKWATFTYYNSTVRKITNLFKHTDIRISLKNNNTISQIFRTKQKKKNKNPEYNMSEIYKLTCKTCQHTHIGQTSWNLK
jgi:hypothetical protein